MEEQLAELRQRLIEIDDLRHTTALLAWDQSTYMPPGGAPARGRQLATLSRLAHERAIDPQLGTLLEELRSLEEQLPEDDDTASLIRVTRREYERATRVPPAFMAEIQQHMAQSFDTWSRARPENDFDAVIPMLERTLELSRRYADFFPGYAHIADPLIDSSDYGMSAEKVRTVFAELREQLVPLVQAIVAQPAADDSCLRQHYPEAPQRAFGERMIRCYGYDFARGRQDKTAHPFMTKFSLGDVRITTRFREDHLGDGLFSTLHECGHALYEQGIDPSYEGTPLANGTSAGVHESQSRLWENLIGRSRACWEHWYPLLQASFPAQLGNVKLEQFYRAINKVERSLIRTDADEVTYNLHVMIRFDLELELLEDKLAVRDLPEAWRERYRADLGLVPEDDRDGVMQDVHWYAGPIGGVFQGYTLGNIMSAQFYAQALAAQPQIETEIAGGEYRTLHNWLREHIYRHGSKYTASELLARVTGESLRIEPYMAYLRGKYADLYQL